MSDYSAFDGLKIRTEAMIKTFRRDTVADWAAAHPSSTVTDLLTFLNQEADEARAAMIDLEVAKGNISRAEASTAVSLLNYRELD
jgi:hypothetical protein